MTGSSTNGCASSVSARKRRKWLQPGVKVDAKGEMSLSLYDGKPDISCRVEELNQYVPEAGNDNR